MCKQFTDDGYVKPRYNKIKVTETFSQKVKVEAFSNEGDAIQLAEDFRIGDVLGLAMNALRDIADGKWHSENYLRSIADDLERIECVGTYEVEAICE